MGTYFRDIWQGVTTILIGMKVTFKHLWMPTITVQYPHETLPMNNRTRARLVNYEDECSVCMACARVCPVNIVNVKGIRAGKDEDLGLLVDGKPKKMHLIEFDIDFSKCIYCGLCVDSCEGLSLRWEGPQEDSTFTRDDMFKNFVTMPETEKIRLRTIDEERKKARAAAKAAKPPRTKKPIGNKVKPNAEGVTTKKENINSTNRDTAGGEGDDK